MNRNFKKTIKGTSPVLLVHADPKLNDFTNVLHRLADCSSFSCGAHGFGSITDIEEACNRIQRKYKSLRSFPIIVMSYGSVNQDVDILTRITHLDKQATIRRIVSHVLKFHGLSGDVQPSSSLQSLNHVMAHVILKEGLLDCNLTQFRTLTHAVMSIIEVVYQSQIYADSPVYEVSLSKTPAQGIIPNNRVELSSSTRDLLGLHENDHVYVIDYQTGHRMTGIVKEGGDWLPDGQIALTSTGRANFNDGPDTEPSLLIQKADGEKLSEIRTQDIVDVRLSNITVATNIYERLKMCGAKSCEIKNNITGASLDIEITKIKSGKIPDSSIKLNYTHRRLLDLDLPRTLPSSFLKQLSENRDLDPKDVSKIEGYYASDKILQELDYAESQNLQRALKRGGYYSISLYPIFQGHVYKELPMLKYIGQALLNRAIGRASMQLRAVRPYAMDETSDVVRVSTNVLKLLGISETDNVVILYRGVRVKARAFVMAKEIASETVVISKESDLNLTIGIPTYLRNKLGMNSIDTVCTIERDTWFLFKKNLNLQLVPVLGVMFAAIAINLPLYIRLISALFILPLAIYVSLSQLRAIVSKDPTE